jgi:deazaflavin-dependent oxidoreductase (nitroreductase family)
MDANRILARIARSFTRFRRVQPQVGRVHAAVLRRSGGRIRRSVLFAGGQPVLALTTTGRRSGRPRSTVVAYTRHRDAFASAGLNLGSDRDPAWALNVRADPRAWIEMKGERKAVLAREANGEEAEELWREFIDRVPMIASSRELAQRDPPIFVWEPRPEPRRQPAGRGSPIQ